MKLSAQDLSLLLGFIGEADKYLDVGEEMVKKAKPTVVRALKLALKTIVDVADEMRPELNRLAVITAASKWQSYHSYIRAGFTPEQAFSLVLASVKPVEFTKQLGESVGKAVSGASEKGKGARVLNLDNIRQV